MKTPVARQLAEARALPLRELPLERIPKANKFRSIGSMKGKELSIHPHQGESLTAPMTGQLYR